MLAAASKLGEGKVVISLDALIAQLNDLKNYISALQTQINQLVAELAEIRSGENVISEMKAGLPEEMLAPADRRGYVMLRAKPLSNSSVVVRIGGNYYAELSLEKAVEVLLSREKELGNILAQLRKELGRASEYHDQLQLLVNSLIAQAKRQSGKQG